MWFLVTVMVFFIILFLIIAWIDAGRKDRRPFKEPYGSNPDRIIQHPGSSYAIQAPQTQDYFPYTKKDCLMTPREQVFFRKLQQVYGEWYYIFPQVNLDKILKIDPYTRSYTYKNKIDRKSVDFVIVNKETLQTEMALELDDYTHLRGDRVVRDNFVNETLTRAGVKLARLEFDYLEKEQLLRSDLKEY